jgi:TRAP-type C4-dicarboxylate transport system permease small subunit
MILGDVPLWLAHAIVPLAFALVSYRFLVRVFSLLHDIFRPRETAA